MAIDPSERVQHVLDALLPGTRVLRFSQSTKTAEEAASAVGCPVGAIVKSLLFLVDGEPLLVLVAGDRQVSDTKLAQHFGVGRKRVRMSDPPAVLEIAGFAVGGVPPIGHPRRLPVLIDTAVTRFEIVYAAAGTATTVFPVRPTELQRITGADMADLAR